MFSNYSLLQIADDTLLAATRSAIFRQAGIPTRSVDSEAFLKGSMQEHFCVCLICQSVPLERAVSIAQRRCAFDTLLKLHRYGERVPAMFDLLAQSPIDPRELVLFVNNALMHGAETAVIRSA